MPFKFAQANRQPKTLPSLIRLGSILVDAIRVCLCVFKNICCILFFHLCTYTCMSFSRDSFLHRYESSSPSLLPIYEPVSLFLCVSLSIFDIIFIIVVFVVACGVPRPPHAPPLQCCERSPTKVHENKCRCVCATPP